MDWIDREFLVFDPFDGSPENTPDEAVQTALGELALVTLVFKRYPVICHDQRLDRWLEYIYQAYRQPAFYSFMFTGHPLALTGHLILWLASTYKRDDFPVSRHRIQNHLDEQPVTVSPRPWDRWIELRYFLDRGGFRHDLPSQEDFFLCSPFAENLETEVHTEADLYALTHMVMYLCDFGRRLPTFFSEKRIEGFLNIIDQAIGRTILDHHWDLLAELLYSRQCFSDDENNSWRLGWEALYRALDKQGAVPERPDGKMVKVSPGRELTREEFLSLYHRTLMTALAAFIGLARGSEC